jgi:hypothetical protein
MGNKLGVGQEARRWATTSAWGDNLTGTGRLLELVGAPRGSAYTRCHHPLSPQSPRLSNCCRSSQSPPFPVAQRRSHVGPRTAPALPPPLRVSACRSLVATSSQLPARYLWVPGLPQPYHRHCVSVPAGACGPLRPHSPPATWVHPCGSFAGDLPSHLPFKPCGDNFSPRPASHLRQYLREPRSHFCPPGHRAPGAGWCQVRAASVRVARAASRSGTIR